VLTLAGTALAENGLSTTGGPHRDRICWPGAQLMTFQGELGCRLCDPDIQPIG
jgi:hypothetical protein